MSGRISPPFDQWDKLRRPLSECEELVARFFVEKLPDKWEIYIHPHLNGLRPDFVLLHPNVGIAVFEVRDWNPDEQEYFIEKTGGVPSPMRKDGDRTVSLSNINPVTRVKHHKEDIYELYCPSLRRGRGLNVITAGVIFPYADDEKTLELFDECLLYHNMKRYADVHPVSGREALKSGDITKIFPRALWEKHRDMAPEIAAEARRWLVEPGFSDRRRTRFLDALDPAQRDLVVKDTGPGYRRLRGPAGSGKSLVVAGRAAELAMQDKQVLIVSYNITLIKYLSGMAVRHCGGAALRNVTFLNFHHWCRSVAQDTGNMEEYNELLKHAGNGGADALVEGPLPHKTAEWLESDKENNSPRYDAILVDEGQDFRPDWWNILCGVLLEGGEMMLAADTTQDIYGRAGSWTDEAIETCGFPGPWNELDTSFRMPPEMAEHACEFARRFLPEQYRLMPQPADKLKQGTCTLRWVQVSDRDTSADICSNEAISMLAETGGSGMEAAGVTIIVDNMIDGLKIGDSLAEKNIRTINTFARDEQEARKKKLVGFTNYDGIRMTTIQTFKGWGARALLVFIDTVDSPGAKARLYTAITRLKYSAGGCFLTVVCADPELADYGKTWNINT